MTTVIPPEAQQAEARTLVLAAAGHPNMGDLALYQGTIYAGAPTTLVDRSLVSSSTNQSWRYAWLYMDSGPNLGQQRFITAVDGATGTLRWQLPFDYPLTQGERFILFRDYGFEQWLRWLNETARNIHYPLDVYVPHDPQQQDRLRYTLPEPIQRAGWLQEVLVGPATVTYTSPEGRYARWYKVNPLNVEGDLYLVLSRPMSASQQLLLRAKPPFAYEHQTPYTTATSVLFPAGRDSVTGPAVRPPVRLFILGTVWRALQQKLANLTGQARQVWAQNLERHARQYAEACKEWGIEEVGRELGYREDWYDYSGLSWSLP